MLLSKEIRDQNFDEAKQFAIAMLGSLLKGEKKDFTETVESIGVIPMCMAVDKITLSIEEAKRKLGKKDDQLETLVKILTAILIEKMIVESLGMRKRISELEKQIMMKRTDI